MNDKYHVFSLFTILQVKFVVFNELHEGTHGRIGRREHEVRTVEFIYVELQLYSVLLNK